MNTYLCGMYIIECDVLPKGKPSLCKVVLHVVRLIFQKCVNDESPPEMYRVLGALHEAEEDGE